MKTVVTAAAAFLFGCMVATLAPRVSQEAFAQTGGDRIVGFQVMPGAGIMVMSVRADNSLRFCTTASSGWRCNSAPALPQ